MSNIFLRKFFLKKIANAEADRDEFSEEMDKQLAKMVDPRHVNMAKELLNSEDPISKIHSLDEDLDSSKVAYAAMILIVKSDPSISSVNKDILKNVFKTIQLKIKSNELFKKHFHNIEKATQEEYDLNQSSKQWKWKPLDWMNSANNLIKKAEQNKNIFNIPFQIAGTGKLNLVDAAKERLSNFSWTSDKPDYLLINILGVICWSNTMEPRWAWNNFLSLSGVKSDVGSIEPRIMALGFNGEQIKKIKQSLRY